MKKKLSLFLSALIFTATLTVLFAVQTSAADANIIDAGSCGDNLTWTFYDDGKLIISGIGDMTNWNGTRPPWYYKYSDKITSVVIKKGVTNISTLAFSDCSNLTSVDIPNGVTSIGTWAFLNCSSIERIVLPDSITIIHGYAFEGCSSLKVLTFRIMLPK